MRKIVVSEGVTVDGIFDAETMIYKHGTGPIRRASLLPMAFTNKLWLACGLLLLGGLMCVGPLYTDGDHFVAT